MSKKLWHDQQKSRMELVQLRRMLQEDIMSQMNFKKELNDEQILELVDETILDSSRKQYLSLKNKEQLAREIYHSIRKMDVLSELLEDEEITEIMINGASNIFIEKNGRLSKIEEQFPSEDKLKDVIQQIVAGCNRIVNETNPIVDARLENGDRVNIVLPPVALDGAVVTIRKFPKLQFTMERLVKIGALSAQMARDLEVFIKAGYNIFISGGTGSGKTTFLNALSADIEKEERVITIEDSAELSIQQVPNLVRLEMRNANVEGKNEITIRDLIKSSLRMRPDRIIIGEVRDAAAQDMITAMNTGHCGLSTGHANSAADMMLRLETMVLMGVDMPVMAIRQQIASALDIVVHLSRMRDHSRKVTEIVEVDGLDDQRIALHTLYHFEECADGAGMDRNVVHGEWVVDDTLLHRNPLIHMGLEGEYERNHG